MKNTWVAKNIDPNNNHCRGRCLQHIPDLPPSLVFLILNQQNITEILYQDALADIKMVSLWGNPVCGIYSTVGQWRNLSGKAKWCTIMASAECISPSAAYGRHL